MFGLRFEALYSTNLPGAAAWGWRQTRSVTEMFEVDDLSATMAGKAYL